MFLRGMMALALVALAAVGYAATDRVVAVVNDQVITLSQLEARTTLTSRQIGGAPPRALVMRRVLSEMVDEELQRQYAEAHGITVDKSELVTAKANAVSALGGDKRWQELTRGVEAAATAKLRGEVVWQKIMARDVSARVNVGTAEVDRLITELGKSKMVAEREISVIQLNVEKDADDAAVEARMKEVKEKLAKGEKFEEMAKAVSDDKSAVNGGKLGWFASGQLNPQLEEALDTMQKGAVSEPIRTPQGWYLVRLDDTRQQAPVETQPVPQVDLYLLAYKTPNNDKKALEAMKGKMDKAVSTMGKAKQVRGYFERKQYGETFDASKALGFVALTDLQPELRSKIEKLKPGQWSELMLLGRGDNVLMTRAYVAEARQVMPRQLDEYRAKVTENLANSRGELAARKFMRELRQRAFLDVRL